jgi:TolB protein
MTLLKSLAVAAVSCALALPCAALAQSRAIGPAWQLTYSYNLDPSLSPDGKRMVYIAIIEGKEQLFVMAADGSGQKQITHGEADLEDPAWSPDGTTIAFIRIEAKDKRVWLMDPDGSNQRPLTPPAQHAIHPSWTPDGGSILYCTDDDLDPPRKNAAEIYRIDVASRQVRTLISGGVNTYPVMSPDGTKIAFRRMIGEMNSEVFVANADGTGAKNLTNHPSFEGWPAWSPDGRTIAFGANRNSSYQIFLMDADGSNVRLLANTEGRATAPKWSTDGTKVYFTNCKAVDYGRGCEILAAKVEPFVR